MKYTFSIIKSALKSEMIAESCLDFGEFFRKFVDFNSGKFFVLTESRISKTTVEICS